MNLHSVLSTCMRFVFFLIFALLQIQPVPVLAAYQRTWNTRPIKTQMVAEEEKVPLKVSLSLERLKCTSDYD